MVKRLPFTLALLAVVVIGCLSHQAAVTNSASADASGRLTDFNKQLANGERVLTSDYAWSPSGREIAVYYATFGRGSVTQKIDILRLDRAY